MPEERPDESCHSMTNVQIKTRAIPVSKFSITLLKRFQWFYRELKKIFKYMICYFIFRFSLSNNNNYRIREKKGLNKFKRRKTTQVECARV